MRARADLPIYVLISRRGPRTLPEAVPARADVLDGQEARPALLGYRQRATAAAWIEGSDRGLRAYPVRSVDGLDRLAAVALVQLHCRWLALEPALGGLTTECFIDLAQWLESRMPLSQTLYAFCRRHDLEVELPGAIAKMVS